MTGRRLVIGSLALGVAAGLVGCGTRGALELGKLSSSASPARGKALIGYYGCGACHVIGGIATANGHVGPPLTDFASRYHQIVGVMPNTPANLEHWIENPRKVLPRGDMPTLGIGPRGAEDIASYLYGQ
ncbi:MAG: c-type cytochrome [Gaiellaceae bacterium]